MITVLFFGFIIPFFSVEFEIRKATEDQSYVDNFTLLYALFRFPVWWLIGIWKLYF